MKPHYLLLPLVLLVMLSCHKKNDTLINTSEAFYKKTRLTNIYVKSATASIGATLEYDKYGYLVGYNTSDSGYNSSTELGYPKHMGFERDNNHKITEASEDVGYYHTSTNIIYDENDLVTRIDFERRHFEYTYENGKIVQILDTGQLGYSESRRYYMVYNTEGDLTSLTIKNWSYNKGTIYEHAIVFSEFTYNEQVCNSDIVMGIEDYYSFMSTEPQFLSKHQATGYKYSGSVYKAKHYTLQYNGAGYLISRKSSDSDGDEIHYYTYKDL